MDLPTLIFRRLGAKQSLPFRPVARTCASLPLPLNPALKVAAMNEIEPAIKAGYVVWITAFIGAYALYQAYRAARDAVLLFKYRNDTFSDPDLQALVDKMPPRSIWRSGLLAFMFAAIGVLFMLAGADLYWDFL